VTLALHVQPGARKTELGGLHGTALKVRLAAPPVDGKANEALIAFVARLLAVPRSRVTLVGGAASRHKLLRVEGCDEARLAALEAPPGD
jgi:hypothetical protein